MGVQLKLLPPEAQSLVLAGALLSIVANHFLFSWISKSGAAALQPDTPRPS
jgi:CPA2 family monovalent cation:H+ antiporter-2